MFGYKAYVHVPKKVCKKLDERTNKMSMMGYAPNGYILWNLEKWKIIIATNVVFNEEKDNNEANENICFVDKDSTQNPTRNSRLTRMPKLFDDYYLNLTAALSSGSLLLKTPTNYQKAVKWNLSMKNLMFSKEMKLGDGNSPADVPIIDTKWIFCEKQVQGEMIKKTCLVDCGCFQPAAFDEEVYLPVVWMVTIHVQISLIVKNLHMQQ